MKVDSQGTSTVYREDSTNHCVTRVLLDSLDASTCIFVRSELEPRHHLLVAFDSDTSFEEVIREKQPHVVIFDHIHNRRTSARNRIGLIKQLYPEARIIVVSEHPTEADGAIIELGVFYYLTGPVGRELIRVIEAASSAAWRLAGKNNVSSES